MSNSFKPPQTVADIPASLNSAGDYQDYQAVWEFMRAVETGIDFLPTRVRNALLRQGISTVGQLKALSLEEALRMRLLGEASWKLIRDALRSDPPPILYKQNERAAKAVNLRRDGKTLKEIGAILGRIEDPSEPISLGRVQQLIKRGERQERRNRSAGGLSPDSDALGDGG